MLRRAIVVGASSGMGAALGSLLAANGFHVALLARRQAELDALAESLRAAHPDRTILTRAHDVADAGGVDALFDECVAALDGLDLLVYAAGVMPAITEDEYSTSKDKLIVDVNVTGALAWCNAAARRFEVQKGGTIVGISSVAGDRGRRGQPAYCASKAALTTYLEALRNRLSRYGVSVITIKPGPVSTPMTEGLDGLPMLIPVDQAARSIWKAIERGRPATVYVPPQWGPIMTILRHVPSVIFRRMSI